MGLDQYLICKREHQMSSGVRGACNGLIPLAPKTENEEVGYWRKAYAVSKWFWEKLNITEDDNCKSFEVSKELIEELLEEAKYNLSEECYLDDWEKYDWKSTIQICQKALNLIETDKAKIYYMEWY